MNLSSQNLFEFLRDLAPTGVIALTGGGGKTSLLYALASEHAARGQAVLCTTTTRMAKTGPDEGPKILRLLLCEDPADIPPPQDGALLAGKQTKPGRNPEYLHGYAPEEIDALNARRIAPRIIVEADGASRRPLKAPAAHEPQVPSSTSVLIGVIGLCCMGKPLCDENVFRSELFSRVTGLAPFAPVTPEAVAALVLSPEGLFKACPPTAHKLLLCNQADLAGAEEAALALARAVRRSDPAFLQGIFLAGLKHQGLLCKSL